MNNLIYEYVASENVVKINANDFQTLLRIKLSYEKLIKRIPNNVLQQRIDKAIKYINYMFDKANENDIIDDLLKIEKILKGSEE